MPRAQLCKHCRKATHVPDGWAGEVFVCPHCGRAGKPTPPPTPAPVLDLEDDESESRPVRVAPVLAIGGIALVAILAAAFVVYLFSGSDRAGARRESSNDSEPVRSTSKEKALPQPSKPVAVLEAPRIPEPAPPKSREAIIAEFLETYQKTPFADRAKYVLDVKEFNSGYPIYYKGQTLPGEVKLAVTEIKEGPKEKYLTVTAVHKHDAGSEVIRWYLVDAPGGLKVDWGANLGYNPTGFKAWQAGTDRTVTLRVKAELSDYYNYHYSESKPTHYSIRLLAQFGDRFDSFHGYVPKDSVLGKRLFEIVKDGQRHEVVVTIERTGEETSVVDVTKLVSESWVITLHP